MMFLTGLSDITAFVFLRGRTLCYAPPGGVLPKIGPRAAGASAPPASVTAHWQAHARPGCSDFRSASADARRMPLYATAVKQRATAWNEAREAGWNVNARAAAARAKRHRRHLVPVLTWLCRARLFTSIWMRSTPP